MDQNFFCNKENLYPLKPYTAFCFADQKSSLPWELQKKLVMTSQGYNRNMSAGKLPVVQVFTSKMLRYFQPENKMLPQILLPNSPSPIFLQIFTKTCSHIYIYSLYKLR